MLEIIRSILENDVVNTVSVIALFVYFFVGMIAVGEYFDGMSETSKTVVLFVIPFILAFFACGSMYHEGVWRLFAPFPISFFCGLLMIGFRENFCDKE